MKTKKTSWVDVKKSLRNFELSQIIGVVKDLYQLSEENKTFLDARCLGGDESIKRYKKRILKCLYPDVSKEKGVYFDFDRSDKAINDYLKATGDDAGTADLMIYYIECGNKFTLEYGDIDEVFYDTLIEMYEKAIDCVCKMPKRKQAPFRKRLEKIMKSSHGIGWGYHDGLGDLYYGVFQQ
jgi:hypothetical protein